MAITAMGKITFWNKIRVERNIRIRELTQIVDKSQSALGMYFSGQVVPPDDVVRTLCDFFDIDYDLGRQEFIKAHDEYVNTGNKGLKRYTTGEGEVTQPAMAYSVVQEEPKGLFEMVYGKIPYDEFMKFTEDVAQKKGNPLERVYGKVPLQDFLRIEKIIGGEAK